jgi:hypothetical protein
MTGLRSETKDQFASPLVALTTNPRTASICA